jgi:hypothetical protein
MKTEKVIGLFSIGDAVLSHGLPKQPDERILAQKNVFNQICNHPYVGQRPRIHQVRLVQYHIAESQFHFGRQLVWELPI